MKLERAPSLAFQTFKHLFENLHVAIIFSIKDQNHEHENAHGLYYRDHRGCENVRNGLVYLFRENVNGRDLNYLKQKE